MRLLITTTLLLAALATAPAAQAAWYDDAGATWTQAFFTEPDGTTLHADVLRPKGLSASDKTPVILSIGPYFNHSGQTGPAGPVEGTSYDPIGQNGAVPSDRFADFVTGAKLMAKGYTWVMVDLRGFGGSSGCLDWGGPGEQADVKAAVEWAAKQPWSTGAVGMYGKSYDGVTGLIGEAVQPQGLKAVVSQEPVYDLYRYLYTNGVRYENSLATPALYDAIAATPGPAADDPNYNLDAINDIARPGCPAGNYLDQASNPDHGSAYWKARDFIAATKGHKIPLFLTQGFLENNTKPDGAWDLYNGLAGPKRAWFGMWDHIRGNETDEGLDDAKQPWFDEVMRFYDQYLKGEKPAVADPPIKVQTSDQTWRAEEQWPPADAVEYTTKLNAGSYTDGRNAGSNDGVVAPTDSVGSGVWTISPGLKSAAHLAGVPRVKLEVSTLVPNANVSVDLYDIDGEGTATILSRTAYLLPMGASTITADMYGNDWIIKKDDRIGVLVSSANSEWWAPTPTFAPVTVSGGEITLPFLRYTRPVTLKGKRSARYDRFTSGAPFKLDDATQSAGAAAGFGVPPAMVPAPKLAKPRVRLAYRGARRLIVSGTAPAGFRLAVTVKRGRTTVARGRGRASRTGRFRVAVPIRRRGAYRVTVVATKGSQRVSGSARTKR